VSTLADVGFSASASSFLPRLQAVDEPRLGPVDDTHAPKREDLRIDEE